jgi:hypothetical protein
VQGIDIKQKQDVCFLPYKTYVEQKTDRHVCFIIVTL